MRKKLEPVFRFFQRLAKTMKNACHSGLLRRAGASVSGAKARICRFFMGLWKNLNSARRAGLFRQLAATVRGRKEVALLFLRERILDRDSALRSALLKQGAALFLMVLVTVGSVETVMASTHLATVTCDGAASRVEMTSPETDQILLKAGVQTGPDDLISRSDDPDHAGDVLITVKTARKVNVEADGTDKTVTAHYGDTVGDVLDQAGVTLDSDDLVTPAESKPVEDGTGIQVTRMVRVTVAVDGAKVSATVKEGSVSDAVRQAGVSLGSEDTLNVSPDETVNQGMEIDVSRVTYKEETETREVPFQKITQKDSSLAAGKTKIKTAGKNGSAQVVLRRKLVDGKVAETQTVSTSVVTKPVDQVTLVGTKKTAVRAVGSNGTLTDKSGKTIKYKKVLTGKCSCYTGGGWTSTGAKAAFGRVAVNPNLIPYGTKLYIASPDGKLVYGYAVASDTGGAAMRGIIIADLYYDSYSQCMKIGTRTMNVYVL
ncbi:3D domain-containing protein [Caproicibacter fermentans]|uniref:G5 domain-containing protein n=1 Tax=Caproicibacter fermentans TaxID=2576756 RepID=A0A7G8T7F2_9FIRM|nr:3D domain-containing protein [Caproicibacter fermentans]QNK39543.1 G5 domain-containing protein [Caproicibacter fermentans]